jgi:uncharacterized protein YecE (DUF72 family)
MKWTIGCCGYHYPDWKRMFYPEEIPQQNWFEYYCSHFNTIELNMTYYKFPRLETLTRWKERSPEEFSFTLKAPRHITHSRKFKDARNLLSLFNDMAKEGLGEKLGCLLFQFPSDFEYDAERLSRLTEMLDASIRNVVEFRHVSWWNTAVYDALAKSNITFCGMSHPRLPGDVVRTTDTLYYRFQGVPHLYNSLYETQRLDETVHAMLNHGSRRAFVYFNNTADGHAITNAKQLQDMCELVH